MEQTITQDPNPSLLLSSKLFLWDLLPSPPPQRTLLLSAGCPPTQHPPQGMHEPITQSSPSSAVPSAVLGLFCIPLFLLAAPSAPCQGDSLVTPSLCSAVPTISARAPQVCSTNISRAGEIPLDCCPISQVFSSSTSTLKLSLPSVPPAQHSPGLRFLPKLSDFPPALHTFSHA